MKWFNILAPSINQDRNRFLIFVEKNMSLNNWRLRWFNILAPPINQDRKIVFFFEKKKMRSNMYTSNHA